MSGGPLAARAAMPAADRVARLGERVLRAAADVRFGIALLLVAAGAHAVAAAVPAGPDALDGPWYVALLGAVVLSGLAAFAVRAPATWREWRSPGAVVDSADALVAMLPGVPLPDGPRERRMAAALRGAGYRVRIDHRPGGWALHGVRRGWSRFAAQATHLGMVLLVVGAAAGAAFGSETTFSLLPGEQALLDAPRPGFSDAVRLERLDAEFGADERPLQLDVEVSFLRGGEVVERRVLAVNDPGTFGDHVVHPWTYGPAATIRITTLGGRPLHDGAIALDSEEGGRPFGVAELPASSLTMGLALVDAERNELAASLAGPNGLIDVARLQPGSEVRIGDLLVSLDGFSAWVTFLSRNDPGVGILLSGGVLLAACLAIAFWFPRRRVTLRWASGTLRVTLRGERGEAPGAELVRVRDVVANAG